jgi:hypothetical protein
MQNEKPLDYAIEIEFSLICLEDAIRDRDKTSWDYYRAEFYRQQGAFLTELRQQERFKIAQFYEQLFQSKYAVLNRRWHELVLE